MQDLNIQFSGCFAHIILLPRTELPGQTCWLYNPMETLACNKIGFLNLGRHNSHLPELSEREDEQIFRHAT